MSGENQSTPVGPGLLRPVGLVFGLTLTVNVVNYVRDAAVVAHLGAGGAADALLTVLLFAGLLLQLLVTGSVAPSLITVYQELRTARPGDALTLISTLLTACAAALTLLAAAGVLWAPGLIGLLLPGSDPSTQAMAVQAARFVLPGSVCMILSAILGAVLNAHGRFGLPAVSPAALGLAVIAVLTFVPRPSVGELAAAAAVGMALQLAIHLAAARVAGWHWRRPRLGPAVQRAQTHRVIALSLPLIAYLGASHVVTVFERIFASTLGGGTIARLTLAQKIASLPLFLIAGSVSTVLLPRLAGLGSRPEAFRRTVADGLRAAGPPLLLAMIWLLGATREIVDLLYRHGAFTEVDAARTAVLLRAYAGGVLPAGVALVCLRALNARQDVSTPLRVGAISLVVYLVAARLLLPHLGALGLALALTATTAVSAALLAMTLVRRHEMLGLRDLGRATLVWLPAATGALATCLLLGRSWSVGAGSLAQFVRVVAMLAASGAVFASVGQVLGRWSRPRPSAGGTRAKE
ncbi:MAG: murein biosynthesis integral membrane protein MurJ [Acidobacteriota bacterium]